MVCRRDYMQLRITVDLNTNLGNHSQISTHNLMKEIFLVNIRYNYSEPRYGKGPQDGNAAKVEHVLDIINII